MNLRRRGATAVAGAVAALALLLVPARADAHAELVSTEPAASQQLATAPDQVVLHFTESVSMTEDTIEVLDATGARVEVGEPELTLVEGEGGHGGEAAGEDEMAEGDTVTDGEAATVSVTNTASQDDVDSANTLATIGIVVGVLGLLAGAFAIFRSRRSA